MKRLIICFFVFISVTSCTKVLYTHQEYMETFYSKQDVINRFGLPTVKQKEGDMEEWVYDLGTQTMGMGMTNGRATINPSPYSNGVDINGNRTTLSTATTFNRYIKFDFNSSDRVVGWHSQGVNLEQRVKQPGKTWALVIAALATSVGLGVLLGSE